MKELIKKLGGFTEEECLEKCNRSYQIGVESSLTEVREYMKELNGLCAEDWCDNVWRFVDEKRQRT